MTRVAIIALFTLLLAGCNHTSHSSEDSHTLERQTILDEMLARKDLRSEWDLAERDLPSDAWSTHPKIGKFNDSRFEREMALTHKLLDAIKPRIQKMNPSELLDSLKLVPHGASYAQLPPVVLYVWRDGNEMIMDELKRRPKNDLEVLRSHTNDSRDVFDDGSGPGLTVGELVQSVVGIR